MKLTLRAAIAALLGAFVPIQDISACTRVVYLGAGGFVVTARSMDWRGDVHSDLWVFLRGLKRVHRAVGNAAAKFEKAEPFKFLSAAVK